MHLLVHESNPQRDVEVALHSRALMECGQDGADTRHVPGILYMTRMFAELTRAENLLQSKYGYG